MSANAVICLGNIFEGGADLTVLPASAKGTISSSCRRWVDLFGLRAPPFDQPAVHGSISPVFDFPQPLISRKYCYGYSVFNDLSSPEALETLASDVGLLTQEDSELRILQMPLLGTGAGGMKNEDAARALLRGYQKTACPEAVLGIFVFDSERYNNLKRVCESPIAGITDAVDLKLTFMGSGVDFKKLYKALIGRR